MADDGAQRSHLQLLGAASAALAQPGDTRTRLERVLALLVGDVCQELVLDIHEPGDAHTFVTVRADSASVDATDALAVPLRAGERSLGMLSASIDHGRSFSRDDRLLVELLAERIAIHLDAARRQATPENDDGAANARGMVTPPDGLGPEAMLLGIVSHDLRNPLGVVTMGTSLLLAQELTEAQRKLVSKIAAAGHKASGLIGDLLDFTAARGAGVQLSPESMDLHDLVALAVDDLRTTWPGRVIEHEKIGHATSRFDQGRVGQIVTNLIGNALQHGTLDTAVRVETLGEPSAIVFSVRNQGRPIPEAAQQRLFAPLSRGEHAGSRRGSIGLGLFIVHQLVVAHGGTIDVVSNEADGTRFTVRLPREPSSLATGALAPPPVSVALTVSAVRG